MSAYYGMKLWDVSALDDLDIDGSGDTWEWVPPGDVAVFQVAFIVNTSITTAAGSSAVTLTKRVTVGSDTDAVSIGTITLDSGSDLVAGTVCYASLGILDTDGETAEDSTTRYVSPSGATAGAPVVVNMGESLLFTNGTGATLAGAGAVYTAIQYVPLAFNPQADTTTFIAAEGVV